MKNCRAKVAALKHYSIMVALAGLSCVVIVSCGKGGVTTTTTGSFTTTDSIQSAYIQHYSDLEKNGTYANSTRLRDVSFSSSIPRNELIQSLEHPNLQNIENLDLSSSSFSMSAKGAGSLTTDQLVRLLPRLVRLQSLNLQGHGYVNNDVLQSLTTVTGITKLNLHGCLRINEISPIGPVNRFESRRFRFYY